MWYRISFFYVHFVCLPACLIPKSIKLNAYFNEKRIFQVERWMPCAHNEFEKIQRFIPSCLMFLIFKLNSRKALNYTILRVYYASVSVMLFHECLPVVRLHPINRNWWPLKIIWYHVHNSKVQSCVFFIHFWIKMRKKELWK